MVRIHVRVMDDTHDGSESEMEMAVSFADRAIAAAVMVEVAKILTKTYNRETLLMEGLNDV